MTTQEKQPFFSVLIPVFNGEKFISDCIEAILTQNFEDFELIICDDASTDKTMEILKEYEAKDPRIRIITHDVNKRALIARNDLIRAAKGKYCIFADADDELTTDFLKSAKLILDKKHYDIIQFSFYTTGSKASHIRKMGYFSNKELSGGEIFNQFLFGFPNIFAPFAKVYDRELLLKALPEDKILPFIDDVPLTTRAAYFANSYLSLKEKKYFFHYGSGGFSKHVWSDKNIEDFCISAVEILKEFANFSETYKIDHKYYLELESKLMVNLFSQIDCLDPMKKANALRIYLNYFDGNMFIKDVFFINKYTPLSLFTEKVKYFSRLFIKRMFLRLIGKKKWWEP